VRPEDLRPKDLRSENLRTAVCHWGQDVLPEDLLPEAGTLLRRSRTCEGGPGPCSSQGGPARPGSPEACG
jgi:hypothetical protein